VPGGTDRKVKIPRAWSASPTHHAQGLRWHAVDAEEEPGRGAADRWRHRLDIVFHEYGHGLSAHDRRHERQAPARRRGRSDVNAFLLDGDDRIGEYAWGRFAASAATRTRTTC
jgi:hypothetical protein